MPCHRLKHKSLPQKLIVLPAAQIIIQYEHDTVDTHPKGNEYANNICKWGFTNRKEVQ